VASPPTVLGPRLLLGPADVEDDELAAFVAADLGVRHATVLTSSATVFPYHRPAITTAGRYLVTGSARIDTGEIRAFSFFVKVIHAYHRSPLRFAVPEHLRAEAATFIPWRTEADLYRSNLRDRLPTGLTIPREPSRSATWTPIRLRSGWSGSPPGGPSGMLDGMPGRRTC
jgi:hypothetical protein